MAGNLLFEAELFQLKKNRSWSDSNPEPLPSLHIRDLQAKLAGNALKLSFF